MPRKSPFTPDFALAADLANETAKSTQAAIFHLVTLILPEPELPLHVADSNYNIKFDGIEYTRFPMKWSPADINSDGSISKSSIAIANVSRELMYYVEKYNGLKMCRVFIKTVYANVLDEIYTPQSDSTVLSEANPSKNNTAYIEDEFYIDTYSATEQTITFQLEPIIDLEIRLPRRRYMQDSCYWTYKDASTCKYSGVKTAVPELCSLILSAGSTTAVVRLHPELSSNMSSYVIYPRISGSLNQYVYAPAINFKFKITALNTESNTVTLDTTPTVGGVVTVIPYTETPYINVMCGKTLTDCKLRGNEINFGGFPGISGTRRIIL